MALFRVISKLGRIFSFGLLLLVAARVSLISGQQVGVSLWFRGETLPSDSFVDFDDILITGGNSGLIPSNTNPRDALLCVTDLEDCCNASRTVRGDWYFPNGRIVGSSGGSTEYRVNRGANEEINGKAVYGSVRLYRRFSAAPERGRFYCELPSAAEPYASQILYANILNFGFLFNLSHVIISPSTGSTATTAGRTDYSLNCSSTLFDPTRLPSNVPSPNFQWSFNGSASLPSGVTATPTVMSGSNSTSETYVSILQFSQLSQSYTGMYTCRLGPGRLVNSAMVTVNAPAISVQITTSGVPVLGQSGYSLTCGVTGAENLNPSITYQWSKNNGTQTQIQNEVNPKILSFSSLRLSDAGQYTCQATVSSLYLNNNITMMDTQDVTLQIPTPTSVMLSSSIPNPIPPFGSDVTLTCTMELSPAVDVPVTVNAVLTTPDGFMTTSTAQPVMGSTTNYATTFMISSFGRSNSGPYVCRAHLASMPTNAYISNSNNASRSVRVTTGVYLALRGVHIANNSNINIRNIGQSSDSPNGALQCITDKIRCCLSQNPRLGEWYLPNRALVQGTTSTTAFYRSRGDNGNVTLNRPSGVESPTGLFCCEVHDAADTNQILCVNIGKIIITPSGSPIAGEMYALECSAGGLEVESFQWLGPPDGSTPVTESSTRVNIISSATTSQLQFRPIQQSDNGSYSCSATTDGLTLLSEPVAISVNAPSVLVQISNGGTTPTLKEDYQLVCSVSGAENLDPTITYQWMKNSGSGLTQVGANSDTLSFTPLRLSDAASYVCRVTITSSYLTGDIVVVNSQDIRIQIPTQSSIMLTSSGGNSGIQIIGSDVTLTCTVELNPVIQSSEIFSLTVDAQLFKDGTLLALSGPTVTGTTFTYTRRFEPFGRNDSGNYTCTATIRPQSTLTYLTGNETLQSDSVSIKAVSAPPLNVRATQSSSSASVEVSWSPPSDGANNITRYRIYYGNGQSVVVPSIATITLVGLKVDENYVGRTVSIRSESDQLHSELINIPVTVDNIGAAIGTAMCSCTSEVGIAVGAVIVVVCLVVIVIIVIVVLCLWRYIKTAKDVPPGADYHYARRRPSDSAKNKNDFSVSVNMAYGEVNLKPRETEGEYENPDTILKPSGQWTETTATTNMYEAVDTSNPVAPEYASTEEAVCATHHSS